jgi:hypothetical protein
MPGKPPKRGRDFPASCAARTAKKGQVEIVLSRAVFVHRHSENGQKVNVEGS